MVLNLQSWLSYQTDREIIKPTTGSSGLVHYTLSGVVFFGVVIYNFGFGVERPRLGLLGAAGRPRQRVRLSAGVV